MYRHCIYCSADLKTNEAIEGFPIGRTVAFDAAKGRLWAVCAKCGRWNLAPIEERWEPIEQAEKAFRDTRLRVQTENIGIAKLRGGLRLIRVGSALDGEIAAWRYAAQLERRRRRYLAGAALSGALPAIWYLLGLTAPWGFVAAAGAGSLAIKWINPEEKGDADVLCRVSRVEMPDGKPMTISRKELSLARITPGVDGGIAVELYEVLPTRHLEEIRAPRVPPLRGEVGDAIAGRILRRGFPVLNSGGATRRQVERSMSIIAESGGSEAYMLGMARARRHLRLSGRPEKGLTPDEARALEIALHEEDERRALEGELAVLEAAWRDAEEIAGIADRLAIAPSEG
jgi:hypothetical protein